MGVLCNPADAPDFDLYDVRDCNEHCVEGHGHEHVEPVHHEVEARHTPPPVRYVSRRHTPVYIPPPVHYSPRRSF